MQAPLQARDDYEAAQTDTARTVAQESVLADNRPLAVAQRKLSEMANNSPRALQQRAQSDAIHNSPQMVAQRHGMNALFGNTGQQMASKAADNRVVQRAGIAKPQTTATSIPIEVQTAEELQIFTANIGRLRDRLATMAPVQDQIKNGQIETAKTQAALQQTIVDMQPVERKPYILQEAFQNLEQESRDYWLSLENHSDMVNALDKIIEKADAGVQGQGKPVNMRLFNIKIEGLLANEDDVLMVQVQELMKLAGGNRDFLVARNNEGKIPSSFGLNCGSTIMDAFNSTLDEMPGEAADIRTAAQKLCGNVNKTLMERVVAACVARFRWPEDFDDAAARDIIEAAVNYKVGLDDNLRSMYTLMSANAQALINEQLASVYTYASVMEVMGSLVQEYVGAAYNAQRMEGESALSANDLLTRLWTDLGFNPGNIQDALVENADYSYSLTITDAQLESIAVEGGIVERAEPVVQNVPEDEHGIVDIADGAAEVDQVDLFAEGVTTALPTRVAEVVKLEDGINEADNIYYKPGTGLMGSKWGTFDAVKNTQARSIFRDALVYRAMQYLSARMPAANAERFKSRTEFQETSPYKLSHATAELNSINMKVQAFLLMRN